MKSVKNILLFLSILIAPNVIPRTSFMKSFVFRLAIISLLASLMMNSNAEIIISIVCAAIAIAVLQKHESFDLGPNTNVINQCHENVKYADILAKFGGDEEKLKYVLHYSAHCPMNVEYNDNYSPLMATYLANYEPCEFNFGNGCEMAPAQNSNTY
jgi:hypothetical protein